MTSTLADRPTTEREAERITGAWSDPEVWPPEGFGCWTCHIAPPVVKLGGYALCFPCLARRFQGQDAEQVMDWLIHQAERSAAWAEGREARKERDKASLREWLAS